MNRDGKCVMCDSGVEENVVNFLVVCGEFESDRHALVDEVYRIMWAGEWLDEFGNVGNEGKVALLFGKVVKGVSKRVLVGVGEQVRYWLRKWLQRRKKKGGGGGGGLCLKPPKFEDIFIAVITSPPPPPLSSVLKLLIPACCLLYVL